MAVRFSHSTVTARQVHGDETDPRSAQGLKSTGQGPHNLLPVPRLKHHSSSNADGNSSGHFKVKGLYQTTLCLLQQ